MTKYEQKSKQLNYILVIEVNPIHWLKAKQNWLLKSNFCAKKGKKLFITFYLSLREKQNCYKNYDKRLMIAIMSKKIVKNENLMHKIMFGFETIMPYLTVVNFISLYNRDCYLKNQIIIFSSLIRMLFFIRIFWKLFLCFLHSSHELHGHSLVANPIHAWVEIHKTS